MACKTGCVLALAAGLALSGVEGVLAQQTTVATPHPVASHSYYEHFGTSWGIRGNGWFFQFGGPVAPPFGGFDPNAGASFGFAGPNGFLNITAGQGSSTTLVGQAPMVTVTNGGTGAFFDQTLRPFVTGVIPVVGAQPPLFDSVLHERLSRLEARQVGGTRDAAKGEKEPVAGAAGAALARGPSSAERGELSVAEIKARKAADDATADAAAAAEIEALLEKARGAIAAGKPGVARIHLQMAARRAGREQQAAIQKQIAELGAAAK
jgi:hypothetical protein